MASTVNCDVPEHVTQAMECDNEKEFSIPQPNFAPSLIRTRSYDEEARQGTTGIVEDFQLSPINPLHTSLDAPHLDVDHPMAKALPRFRPAPSWEENDPSVASHEPSTRHAHFHESTATTEHPPSTARKMPRHSSDNVTLLSKTPLRPRSRTWKSSAKRTPVSAKRHRAPLHQRRSPRVAQMTPQRSQQLFPPPTARALTPRDGGTGDRFTIARPMPNILLEDDADTTPHGMPARRNKKSIGTVTTAASSHALETTTETEDSMDTNDAPFRFTSFPASLPRVNPLRTPAVAAPATIRKRMNFTDAQSEPVNRSRDDATHSSSVSSLPVDEGNMMYAESDEEQAERDETPRSPMGTPVARTRLDFNSAISPTAGTLRDGQTPLRSRPDAPTTPRGGREADDVVRRAVRQAIRSGAS